MRRAITYYLVKRISIWKRRFFDEIEWQTNNRFINLIEHAISAIVTIEITTFCQYESILKTNRRNVMLLSSLNTIKLLITCQRSKSRFLCFAAKYVNSSMRRKTTKTRQKKACKLQFSRLIISICSNSFNRMFFVIERLFFVLISSFRLLMSTTMRLSKELMNTFKSRSL